MWRVLFLCTGNSARSIMAEGLLNHLGGGRFEAYSAGSHPAGRVNPFARAVLQEHGMWREGYSSKSWDVFSEPGAPHMDFIITVCDNAAGEACPFWPGHPATAHWGFEDPAAFDGPDWQKAEFFLKIFSQIRTKMEMLLALPHDREVGDLTKDLRAIGEIDPSSLGECK